MVGQEVAGRRGARTRRARAARDARRPPDEPAGRAGGCGGVPTPAAAVAGPRGAFRVLVADRTEPAAVDLPDRGRGEPHDGLGAPAPVTGTGSARVGRVGRVERSV